MIQKKLSPETKLDFSAKVTTYATHLGVHIYSDIFGSQKMSDMIDMVYENLIDMPQECDELAIDNTDEINNSCIRTKFLYTLGLNVFKAFSEIKPNKNKPKYFLLDDTSKQLTERIVDHVYEDLSGSSAEENLCNSVQRFIMSLNHTEIKSIYQYEKLSNKKSTYKTKFMAHIGQGIFNWLAPKYSKIFVDSSENTNIP